jgi:hypothetical protein
MKLSYIFGNSIKSWKLVYEGEEEAALKAAEDLLKKSGRVVTTQDDLNKMMAENRRKLTQQNSELIKQLEEIKSQTNLTQQQRDELEQRITALQEQYMTKEEIAKKETEKAKKVFEDQLKQSSQEANSWRTRYATATIRREITDAAVEGKAVSPEQITAILTGVTALVEVLDESGKPTGQFESRVKFNDVDSGGKPVILDLTPTQVIKRMKELPERFGNLFQSTGTGGIGGAGSAGRSTPVSLDTIKDLDAYRKFRKDNPDLDLKKVKR